MNKKEVERSLGVVSSSRRASQEFKNIQNIFEENSQLIQPTEEHSIYLSSISSNIKKGSVRKVNRKFQSVQKHKSVGSLGKSSERESEMDSFSLSLLSSSKRINGQPLLAETKANKKCGRGEGVEGSLAKRIRWPWR